MNTQRIEQQAVPAFCKYEAMETTQNLQAVLDEYVEPRFHDDEIIRRHCQLFAEEDPDPQDTGEPVTDWVEVEPDGNDGPSYDVSARSLNKTSFEVYVAQRILELRDEEYQNKE